MLIEIEDDFDLQKIALSGQCFRVRQFDDGTYRFVTEDSCVYIKEFLQLPLSLSSEVCLEHP